MDKNFEEAKELLVEKSRALIAETSDQQVATRLCNYLFTNFSNATALVVMDELKKLGASDSAIDQMLKAAVCVYDIVQLRMKTGAPESHTMYVFSPQRQPPAVEVVSKGQRQQDGSLLHVEGLKQNIWPKNAYRN